MKTSAFFLSALILLTIFSLNNIFPQTPADTLNSRPENLHTFNIYLLNGYALSYEFSKCNQSLYRVQLDYGSSYTEDKSDGESTTVSSYGTEKHPRTEENSTSSISLSLSAHYIYSFLRTDFGEIYLGAGPSLGFARYEHLSDNSGTSADTIFFSSSSNYIDKTYSIGVVFVLGMKAFITNNLGVFAEANLNGGKRWRENNSVSSNINDYPSSADYSSTNTYHVSGGGWFYNATYVRIGISISI
jgi:hypothetical protein